MEDKFPRVTFILPVLNGGALLHNCLRSIRDQEYPQHLVEIVVADGGSHDNTRQVCESFGCVVIDNPRIRAEYGHELAFRRATGEIFFLFAADNSLPEKDWITRMVQPFMADESIAGVYTHIEPAPWDNSLNRYYCLMHVEPFSWFVFGDTANPRKFADEYSVREATSEFIVYEFSVSRYPLIAWAQGFALKAGFVRQRGTQGDDIMPFIQMVEEQCKLAYVAAGVYHHHLTGFWQYCCKYRDRVHNSLYQEDVGFINRQRYLSRVRALKCYLWELYGCSIIAPVLHSVWLAARGRDACWLWHGPASVALAYIIVYEVGVKVGKRIMTGFSIMEK